MKLMIFSILFLSFLTTFLSGEKKMEPNDFIKLGKKKLVDMAIERLKKDSDLKFDEKLFDRIRLFKNNKSVWVSFSMSICFIPLNSEAVYEVAAFFDEFNGISSTPLANPSDFESKSEPSVFIPTQQSKKIVDFIIASINQSKEVGHFENQKLPDDVQMRIYELKNDYQIEVFDSNTFSRYKINKKTGLISDASHKNFAKEKDSQDKTIEIKD